jgi:hypothetical protein
MGGDPTRLAGAGRVGTYITDVGGSGWRRAGYATMPILSTLGRHDELHGGLR